MPMPPDRRHSQYRQVIAVLTEETGGRFSLRVRVKPVGKQWHDRHTVIASHWRMSDPPEGLHEVLALLARSLETGSGPGGDAQS